MEKVCIVIPAYNEEKRIGRTLEKYGAFFEKLNEKKILEYEILVVINNTKDKTEEIVKIYARHNKNIKCLNFKQGGKGFAIVEGFKEALKKDFSLIGFVDADMATKPDAFYDLIKNIKGYDGIIANRYVRGSIVSPKQPMARILVSRIFNFIIRTLFLMPYTDTQCGAKLFKKNVVSKIITQINITQWAFDVNLLYVCKKNNFKIKEFPTTWEDKEGSKINIIKSSIQMFLSILRLRIIHSRFVRLQKFGKPLAGWLWRAVK